jgi:hypothetical protein
MFDVAILPFKRLPLTEATNPVRAYEILASGNRLSRANPEILAPLFACDSRGIESEIEAAPHDDSAGSSSAGTLPKNTWEK